MSGQQLAKGRFAAAAGTYQPHNLPRLDADMHIPEYPFMLAVPVTQPFSFKWHAGTSFSRF
ncbi:hypothetical protein D3C87_1922760 [compost metagenome]